MPKTLWPRTAKYRKSNLGCRRTAPNLSGIIVEQAAELGPALCDVRSVRDLKKRSTFIGFKPVSNISENLSSPSSQNNLEHDSFPSVQQAFPSNSQTCRISVWANDDVQRNRYAHQPTTAHR